MKLFRSLFGSGKEYNTAIILSGGGARGFAHAGIMKALNEFGIYPDVISGVSAGAIVGALYADGHTPDQIYEIFSREDSFFKFVKFSIPGKGLFRTTGLRKNLSMSLRAETFEDLQLPFFAAATNISSGKITYFSRGALIDRILASAAIPVLFEPVEIEGEYYVDGGVLDNFPLEPVMNNCNRMIGASLNPILPEKQFQTLLSVAERTFRLSVSSNIQSKINRCQLVFQPRELGSFGLLDASKGAEIFEIGYKTAKGILEKK